MKLLRRFFLFVIILLLMLVVIFSTLSFTLPSILKMALKDYDVVLDVKKLNVQVHKGTISIQDLMLKDIHSSKAVTLGHLDLQLNLLSLLQRRVMVESLSVAHVDIPVENTFEHLEIAGIDTARFFSRRSPDTDEVDNKKKVATPDYSFAWQSIKFSDIKVRYTHQSSLETSTQLDGVPINNQSIALSVNSADVGELDSTKQNALTPLEFDITLEGMNANGKGAFAPLSLSQQGQVSVSILDINLETFSALAKTLALEVPEVIESAKGILNYYGGIKWQFASDAQRIQLDKTKITANDLVVTLPGKPYDQILSGDADLTFDYAAIDPQNKIFSLHSLSTQKTSLLISIGDPSLNTSIDFGDIRLNIDEINMANKTQKTQLLLQSEIGEFGKIDLVSVTNLFSFEDESDITVKGEQINLTELSYFSNAVLNRSIKKGALDFTFDGRVERGIVNSKVHLQLHQLGFGPGVKNTDSVADNKISAFETELGIPVNTALNLLRDKNDTIKLDLPITGSIDDPKININSIINKAVIKTLKTAVITQLGPLMAISAVDKLKSLRDATKLQPIYFSPGSSEVSTDAQSKLDKLSAFLTKRKKLFVNVCAFATTIDLSSDLKREQLTVLAKHRMNTVKEYLIESGVSGKRLILCAPQLDDAKDAKPRADFSL